MRCEIAASSTPSSPPPARRLRPTVVAYRRRSYACYHRLAKAAAEAAREHAMVLPRPLLWPGADHDLGWSDALVPAGSTRAGSMGPRHGPLASATGQVL